MNETGAIILTAVALVAAGLAVTMAACGFTPATTTGAIIAVGVLVTVSVLAWTEKLGSKVGKF